MQWPNEISDGAVVFAVFTIAHARVLDFEAVFDLELNNALGSGRQAGGW